MDVTCANQNREHKASGAGGGRTVGLVLLSLGCTRDLSLVISDKILGAQRVRNGDLCE